jgi:hypothetical protein
MATIHKQQGQGYQEIATQGFPEDYTAFLAKNLPFEAAEGSVFGRTVKQRQPIHQPAGYDALSVRIHPGYYVA